MYRCCCFAAAVSLLLLINLLLLLLLLLLLINPLLLLLLLELKESIRIIDALLIIVVNPNQRFRCCSFAAAISLSSFAEVGAPAVAADPEL